MSKKTYFLIYARKQALLALWVVAVLRYFEFNILYDQSLRAGEEWSPELAAMIQKSDAAIFLITRDSLSSEFCEEEYEQMKTDGKRVIPLRFEISDQDVKRLKMYRYKGLRGLQFDEIDANNPTESLLRGFRIPVQARSITESFDKFFLCQANDSDPGELEQTGSAEEPNSQPTKIQSLKPTLDVQKKYRKAKSHVDEGEYQEALELLLEVKRQGLKDNDLERLIREVERAISMGEHAS